MTVPLFHIKLAEKKIVAREEKKSSNDQPMMITIPTIKLFKIAKGKSKYILGSSKIYYWKLKYMICNFLTVL